MYSLVEAAIRFYQECVSLAARMSQESPINPSTVSWLILLVTLFISWILFKRHPKNYPPSPGIALPVIGHCHLLDKNPRHQFKRWARELSPIFSIQIGSIPVVVINGYDLIKEALVTKANYFSGRSDTDILSTTLPDTTKGIVTSSGTIWKEQRTTSMSILRNLGLGKNILGEKISEEVTFYTGELGKTKGEPTDIKAVTNACVSNIICSLIRGKRYDLDDPKFVKYLRLSNIALHLFFSAPIANFVPLVQYIPFDPFQVRKVLTIRREFMKFSFEMVEELKPTYDPENLNNFIVAYLHELKKKRESGEPTELSEQTLAVCIDELFVAGAETITSTISWCLLYALHFPEEQEKVYQEIIDEVGGNRAPTLLDKPKLKYLNAYIMESQRMASIVPFNFPHRCTWDTTLGGYFIPKGTQLIPSLDSVLHDKQIWGDPQNFRPERFLDAQGNLKSDENLIPFSVGKRVCPGESLAKMELFLFMSALFKRFKFLPVDINNIPPLNDVIGLTAPPVSYKMRCVERNS